MSREEPEDRSNWSENWVHMKQRIGALFAPVGTAFVPARACIRRAFASCGNAVDRGCQRCCCCCCNALLSCCGAFDQGCLHMYKACSKGGDDIRRVASNFRRRSFPREKDSLPLSHIAFYYDPNTEAMIPHLLTQKELRRYRCFPHTGSEEQINLLNFPICRPPVSQMNTNVRSFSVDHHRRRKSI